MTDRLGIILHGVTGRMGMNQHLIRSILAIRAEGGVVCADGRRVQLDPIIVGRNPDKMRRLAETHAIDRWSCDLDAALENPADTVFFDAASTQLRAGLLTKAIAAGKHVYCEKPVSDSLDQTLAVCRAADGAGIKHGVVQDKLFLPGLMKMAMLRNSGFFGRLLSVRSEFGYWVFEGDWQAAQRPSWNYRKADGGGIILDMLCHWRYVFDNLFGPVRAVLCQGATHIPQRFDERGQAYAADADDAAYCLFELDGGVIVQSNSSWATRVRRDDLVTFHADGTEGSAVCGLFDCHIQPRQATPKPVWNPDQRQPINFFDTWQAVPDNQVPANGFRAQWEMFLRHVLDDAPYRFTLLEGAKGVQLAELGLQSWAERRWLTVPDLEV